MDPRTSDEELDPMQAVQDRFAPQIEQAKEQLMSLNDTVKTFVRKNPGTTLLGALAVGFVIGKLASRR